MVYGLSLLDFKFIAFMLVLHFFNLNAICGSGGHVLNLAPVGLSLTVYTNMEEYTVLGIYIVLYHTIYVNVLYFL
jgi:hypothetical protein